MTLDRVMQAPGAPARMSTDPHGVALFRKGAQRLGMSP
jgi:hypothetical protein